MRFSIVVCNLIWIYIHRDGWKLPPHFNVAPVIGGFLTTQADLKRVVGDTNALPVVNAWQNDIALCIVTKRFRFVFNNTL